MSYKVIRGKEQHHSYLATLRSLHRVQEKIQKYNLNK